MVMGHSVDRTELPIHIFYTIYRVFQKLCFTFLLISQLILIEESRLEFLRYLRQRENLHLSEILTLIERTIAPLQVHEF